MELFAVLIILFIVAGSLWGLIYGKKYLKVTPGAQEYYSLCEKIYIWKQEEDRNKRIGIEERIKKDLRRKYNLTRHESGIVFLMAREQQKEYVEDFINNRINHNNGQVLGNNTEK